MFKKTLLRVICVALLIAVLLSCTVTYTATTMTKESPKRVIGIVFDNSGSMYLNNNTAWSQAQYAMEVFASMMNAGDEFIIYPMHPITIGKGGTEYSADKPYSVTDVSKANTIRNIYTPKAAGTPGKSTIQKALKSLKAKKGEKWLIVLTDGEFDDANLSEQGALIGDCLKSVNVLYLAMSSAESKLKAPSAKSAAGHIYSGQVANDSSKVPGMLTRMCNKVFGRDELPSDFISGNSFTIDIPMSKVYVFIQGKSISNVKLSGNGKAYSATKVLNPCYGTNGGYTTFNKKVFKKFDASLQGCLAVYENLEACKKGEKYEIEFSGSKSDLSVYYEPDVNLVAQMINPDGTVCMEDQVFTVGDYKLKYFLADKDGIELNSKLLGKTHYTIDYTQDGKAETTSKESSGQIPVRLENDGTFALNKISVEILSGYKIEKTGDELGFLSKGIKGQKGSAGDLKMSITGGKDAYDPDKLSNDAKYTATFTYNGEKITGADLNQLKFNCQIENCPVKASVSQTNDGFAIALSADGDISKLKPGKYVLNCSGTYTTKEAKDAYARADAKFKINDISGSLTAKIEADKSYFVLKELKKEKFLLKLSLNGKPLTDEQLKNAGLKIDADVPLEAKLLPGESAYEISFDTDKNIKAGDYDLRFKVTNVKDRLGNDLVADDGMEITVSKMARWLKFLIWALGILALLALLWYVCTRTALPKHFEEIPCKINYLGQVNDRNVMECMATGNSKEKRINYSCNLDRTQSAGITFRVIPDKTSYWIKPSAKRTALIIPDQTEADFNVTTVKPYGGTKIAFEKGEIPPKTLDKLADVDPELFDCDGKFRFAGQTKKGNFEVEFTPEIK